MPFPNSNHKKAAVLDRFSAIIYFLQRVIGVNIVNNYMPITPEDA